MRKLKLYALCLFIGILVCAISQYISNTYFSGLVGGTIATMIISTIIFNKHNKK